MNKTIMAVGAVSLIALSACKEEEKEPVVLDTFEEKVAYTIGQSVAQSVNIDEFDFDTAAFVQAIEDVRSGQDAQLSDEEMQATMQTFQTKMREIATAKQAKLQEENKAKGDAFLVAKEAEDGVIKTESGLLYKVITEGSGEVPTASDQVVAHYRGTLIDGEEFDSSYSRGEPATFPVGGLIPGWVEALQIMPVGSKWELYIPSDLAYGERGNPRIAPNSTLIFELELLEIVKPEAPAEEAAGEAASE